MQLQIRGVSKTYPNGVQALKDVTLTIPAGLHEFAAGDKLYLVDDEGTTIVLRAGDEYAEVAQKDLGEMSLASLAVDGTSPFIRTEKPLYRIGGSR